MFSLLYEDDDYVIIAKPSGILVHKTKIAPYDRRFVLQLLRKQLKQWCYPVHRLDRATSGCLILARSRDKVAAMQAALADERTTKRYLALVRGEVRPLNTLEEITKPIQIEKGRFKDARTLAKGICSSPEPRCSLVMAWPKTGRNHQVRRHLRDVSHPVLMDGQHGDTRINKVWRREHGLQRLGLHCLSIDVALPDKTISVTCPVPDDLRDILVAMPWWEEALAAVPELALRLPPPEDTEGA